MPRNPLQPRVGDPDSWLDRVVEAVLSARESGELVVGVETRRGHPRTTVLRIPKRASHALRRVVVDTARQLAGHELATSAARLALAERRISQLSDRVAGLAHALGAARPELAESAAAVLAGRVGVLETTLDCYKKLEAVSRHRAEAADAECARLKALHSHDNNGVLNGQQ